MVDLCVLLNWRNGLSIIALAVTAAGLVACEQGAVSLEQAKQITAEFKNQSLTPPPKTISDVLGSINARDYTANFFCKSMNDLDKYYLQNFEYRSLPFEDLKGHAWQVLLRAWDNFTRGNYLRSVELQQLAMKVGQRRNGSGMVAYNYAALAVYHAYAANYPAAARAISTAETSESRVSAAKWRGSAASFKRFEFLMKLGQGVLSEAQDSLIRAEAFYRQALTQEELLIINRLSISTNWRDVTRLALAKNLLRQGRLQEAELVAREAWDHLRHNTFMEDGLPVIAVLRLSEVLFEQGRYADAAKLAAEARELAKAACAFPHSLLLSGARDLLGRSLVAEGRWRDAKVIYESLRDNMVGDRASFERLYRGSLSWALASIRLDEVDDAQARLGAALRQANDRYGQDSYKSAEVRAFIAMARLASGDRAAALKGFADAVPILLKRRDEAEAESTTLIDRDHRLKMVLEDYIGLLIGIRGSELERKSGIDALSESFSLADLARSQSVHRALSQSGARARLPDPALADLSRREQDAHKQISALHATLGNLLGRKADQKGIADLRGKIGRLRSARRALRNEIENKFPAYAELTNPIPPSIDQARADLRPGEALIATYVTDEKTYVWAVPKTGKVVFAAVPLGREKIAEIVSRLRKALDPQATTLGDIPAFDVALSHRLYSLLLKPVRDGWKDAKRLLVVAHGGLGQLPFSVLVTAPTRLSGEKRPLFANYRAVPWLARSHAVTVLPSVSALTTLRKLPAPNPDRRNFVGFGDPWFSEAQARIAGSPPSVETAALVNRGGFNVRGFPVRLRAAPQLRGVSSADLAKLPRLPDTADEVKGIARALNADLARDVFTGKDANEGRVKSMTLSGYKVLAFATHGLVPGDLNGLTQPALALSSPAVVGGKDDGLLTMGEILGLKLNADWVVLSACNTASGQGKGAEAISGLGRAFFYAGTRALLVSNWPVETTSAKALTTDLFRRQSQDPSLSRAEALRRTMMGLIDGPGFRDGKGRGVFSYAHPLFWAPFSLIGDGGGNMVGS